MYKSAIFNEIIKKFKTQKACAEALGISETTFSRNMKIMSPKFIARLKTLGIALPDNEEKKFYSVNPEIYFMQAEEILSLKKRIAELEQELFFTKPIKCF